MKVIGITIITIHFFSQCNISFSNNKIAFGNKIVGLKIIKSKLVSITLNDGIHISERTKE
jgi:hypothetical protein